MTPGEAAVRKPSSTRAPARAASRLSASAAAAPRSRTEMGPVQAGVLRRARPGSPNTRRAIPGKSTRSWYCSGWLAPPKPVRRSFTYVAYEGLLISPSSTTVSPASVCLRTTSATAARMRVASAPASTGTPSSLANIVRMRSSGRGRLPVCVVRNRPVLRFTSGRRARRAEIARAGGALAELGRRLATGARVGLLDRLDVGAEDRAPVAARPLVRAARPVGRALELRDHV